MNWWVAALVCLIFVAVLLTGFVIALDYENRRQRDERHHLKSEIAGLRWLLEHHGIPHRKENGTQ